VTVIESLVDTYIDRAATGAGLVTEMVADRKINNYSTLTSNKFIVQPVATENLDDFAST